LFAALDVATGKVIGECMPRHRHQEFLRFLRTIDGDTPKSLDLQSARPALSSGARRWLDCDATKAPLFGKYSLRHSTLSRSVRQY